MTFVKFESVMKILDYSTLKVSIVYYEVPLKDMMMASKIFLANMKETTRLDKLGNFYKMSSISTTST